MSLSLWISGVLNVFVAGLPGLVISSSTAVSGLVLFITLAHRPAAPVPSVGASCFPNLFFSKRYVRALWLFHFFPEIPSLAYRIF